jgi:hypothetical protein
MFNVNYSYLFLWISFIYTGGDVFHAHCFVTGTVSVGVEVVILLLLWKCLLHTY